jgi:flagellar motor switch protein FliM
MEPILTDEELAALREAQSSTSAVHKEVRTIDLVARDHRVFALLPELQIAGERLARNIEMLFTRMFRASCQVTPQPVEIVPGARLQELWGAPRFVYGLNVAKRSGTGALGIDGVLGGLFVSRQFGGELEAPTDIERAPTSTERRTVARMGGVVSVALMDAVADLMSVKVELEPGRDATPRSAALVLISLKTSLAEQQGRISIALDTAARCFQDAAVSGTPVAVTPQPGALLPALKNVTLTLKGILGRRSMSMREIFALRAGDVLALDTPVDAEVDVLIGDKAKLVGKPMLNRGNLSLEISGAISRQSAASDAGRQDAASKPKTEEESEQRARPASKESE